MRKFIAALFLICSFTVSISKHQSIEAELIEASELYVKVLDHEIEHFIEQFHDHPEDYVYKDEIGIAKTQIRYDEESLADILYFLKNGVLSGFHPGLTPLFPASFNGTLVEKVEYLKILEYMDAAIAQYSSKAGSVADAAGVAMEDLPKTPKLDNFANVLYQEYMNLLNQSDEATDDDRVVIRDLLNLISNGSYSIEKKHYDEIRNQYPELEQDARNDEMEIDYLNREIEYGKNPEDDENMRKEIEALKKDIENYQEEMHIIEADERLFLKQLENWEDELNKMNF